MDADQEAAGRPEVDQPDSRPDPERSGRTDPDRERSRWLDAGTGPSRVGVSGALRARDVSRRERGGREQP